MILTTKKQDLELLSPLSSLVSQHHEFTHSDRIADHATPHESCTVTLAKRTVSSCISRSRHQHRDANSQTISTGAIPTIAYAAFF